MVEDESPLVRKWRTLLDIGPMETDFLGSLERRRRHCERREELLRQGDTIRGVNIVLRGWAIRYKLLPDGRRQIVNFAIPGDLIGFYSAVLTRAQHSIEMLTPSEVGESEVERMVELFRTFPRLATALAWSAGYDDYLQSEQIVRLGRLDARERVAHLFVELHARLKVVGLTQGNSFEFPARQTEVADLLGLTNVYVNRVLGLLRREGLLTVGGGEAHILDYDRLVACAQFSPVELRHIPLG